MLSLYPSSPTSQLVKSHACFEARSNKHYQEKYTECTYKHKNYLYIFIYKIHSKRMGRQLCTNEAPVVNEQTNQTKDKWKKPGRWGKTWDQNLRKEKSQIRWSPWQTLRPSGTAAAFRVAFIVWDKKNLNQVWWHGARVVYVCVRVCCVGGRIWHPVSKLACDGEGTLRFQGCSYFVFLYSYRISLYSQLDFILLILVVLWKKKLLFYK